MPFSLFIGCIHSMIYGSVHAYTLCAFWQAVFEVHPVVNGSGRIKFAWQKSVGNYLAVVG